MYIFFKKLYVQKFPCAEVSGERKVYTYTGKPTFLTAAQLALHVFYHCYLKTPLKGSSSQVQLFERLAYSGGYTAVHAPCMKLGLSIDINSAYPACMLGAMPWDFEDDSPLTKTVEDMDLY